MLLERCLLWTWDFMVLKDLRKIHTLSLVSWVVSKIISIFNYFRTPNEVELRLFRNLNRSTSILPHAALLLIWNANVYTTLRKPHVEEIWADPLSGKVVGEWGVSWTGAGKNAKLEQHNFLNACWTRRITQSAPSFSMQYRMTKSSRGHGFGWLWCAQFCLGRWDFGRIG